jgi:hypothetical protein
LGVGARKKRFFCAGHLFSHCQCAPREGNCRQTESQRSLKPLLAIGPAVVGISLRPYPNTHSSRKCRDEWGTVPGTAMSGPPAVCPMSPGVSYSRSCRALGRSFPAFAERMRMYSFAHQPGRMNGIHLNMKKTILIVAGLLLSVGMMASAAPVSQDGPPPPAGPPPQVGPPPQPPPPPPPPPPPMHRHRHHHHRQSPPPPPPPPPQQ